MRSLALCTIGAFLLWAMAAFAQTTAQPGTPGTAPGASQQTTPGAGQQSGPGMGQQPAGESPTMNEQTNTADTGTHEKTLKGCVESNNGQYELQTKKGKEVALTGQDVAAHVGHEVKVKGTWEKGNMSNTSQAGTAGAERAFNVTSVKMISDSCNGGKHHQKSDTMGTPGTGTQTSPESGTGTGTGTGATPPQ